MTLSRSFQARWIRRTLPGFSLRRVQSCCASDLIERVDNQGALSRTGNPGYADQTPSGMTTSMVLRLFSPCAPIDRASAIRAGHRFSGTGMAVASGQVLPGERARIGHHLCRRPLGHHFAAMHPGPRPHVNDLVRARGSFPRHAQPPARCCRGRAGASGFSIRLAVVPRVEADAGLIKDIEHPHEPGSDLRGQAGSAAPRPRTVLPDARLRVEVLEAHIHQEVEPLA